MKNKLICLALVASYTVNSNLEIIPNDGPFEYKFELPESTYHKFCKNIYSQNGEDGMLEQLIKELEIKEGTFCEFGAADGLESSNTYNLIKNHNFSGIAIESNPKLYNLCLANYAQFENVKVFNGAVFYNDPQNDLNAWLKRDNLPQDFDILSIDIDSDDYHVWEGLKDFNPKIVIIETNSYRDPVFEEFPGKPCQEYNVDLLKKYGPDKVAIGCSFMPTIKLGLKKGYVPIAFTGNITFVRKDIVHKLKEFPYIISENPYDYLKLYTHLCLWYNTWYTNNGLIMNTAIRDYYLAHETKTIDVEWINMRMKQILNNIDVIF